MPSHVHAAIVAGLLAAGLAGVGAAERPQKLFASTWEGRRVVVTARLYSLVFNERGRLGHTYASRREGITVVTPGQGVYFQFDARQHREDVVVREAHAMAAAVEREYAGDVTDVRSYRRVEPLALAQYEPGLALVVIRADVARDTVRLTFAQPDGPGARDEPVSSITVKWPVPFSSSFAERELVEGLLRRFVDLPAAP